MKLSVQCHATALKSNLNSYSGPIESQRHSLITTVTYAIATYTTVIQFLLNIPYILFIACCLFLFMFFFLFFVRLFYISFFLVLHFVCLNVINYHYCCYFFISLCCGIARNVFYPKYTRFS